MPGFQIAAWNFRDHPECFLALLPLTGSSSKRGALALFMQGNRSV